MLTERDLLVDIIQNALAWRRVLLRQHLRRY
ncbi:hypothetical protein J2Y60_003669 [Arcicella sp. BE140]|nr:hypothetical protein [Arcicella sp. BE51]MDR6813458.1 hypothetical protein [Arcicella sp. BE140]MDR6824771.1 hypothetical protein [Arcicella sp. BE139]